MKDYIKHNEWNIIEEGFDPKLNRISESLFSIGNGRMGQRANFEEKYSGDSLQGSYVAGVYYPDKTRVGWWKNGYPEYFAKVINSANWIGIDIVIDGKPLDLATCKVRDFRRVLNMKEGYLLREFVATTSDGKELKVQSQRFCSIVDDQLGAIQYNLSPLNFSGEIKVSPYIDFDVVNEDSNYGEKFWEEMEKSVNGEGGWIVARTNKLDFHVAAGMKCVLKKNDAVVDLSWEAVQKDKYIETYANIYLQEGESLKIEKYASIVSSENHEKLQLSTVCENELIKAVKKGFEVMLREQAAAWALKWEESDIRIDGDVSAQQGIRFNIFQLHQTYTGEDERLNIGPKGFTGEKYGGSTYWDTEAYCLPFYLSTADHHVARNLLLYRYKQLDKAIENASKLGFDNGAALYPMVTMNGEECHNEWEITFEEIHRNGAIAYAIFDYVRYTGDEEYVADYGLEVLIAIARFWSQRVNYSEAKKKYVMLGVTGPNEYENNVNNNWYTNLIASWCMKYALEMARFVKEHNAEKYGRLVQQIHFDEVQESAVWTDIVDNMYYPVDPETGIILQQEGYMDKEQVQVKDLDPKHLPLNQKWSWDRILRSCFIKQADVLQGIYFFEEQFDKETIARNFEFYEARTVHESSLSPCVHSILAAQLGQKEKSYEMYLRTARLDLDDYNNDTEDGCHITSMAGTWLSVVKGFGGMKVTDGQLSFNPFIPDQWDSYSFKIRFRDWLLKINVTQEKVEVENRSETQLTIQLYDKPVVLQPRHTEMVTS
ncbi:glycoside hydrolase family 65 protein [Fulvivirga sp. M361]|uniref:glycoside hydrolase family 65 protein n=1 Tax=Fulvivirga sp. M361 TaxID=2594266 RepID=UPI00117AE377|nr:glycoside hydrolase family 65 protein [Fulvivirga sp. M361]TRX50936.1 glycoside hydrolase family 65 protein [Fulvivirga sp. M361]